MRGYINNLYSYSKMQYMPRKKMSYSTVYQIAKNIQVYLQFLALQRLFYYI